MSRILIECTRIMGEIINTYLNKSAGKASQESGVWIVALPPLPNPEDVYQVFWSKFVRGLFKFKSFLNEVQSRKITMQNHHLCFLFFSEGVHDLGEVIGFPEMTAQILQKL